MGGLIALLDKNGEDATEAAFTMLGALSLEHADAYGIASPSIIKVEKAFEKLRCLKLRSNTVIGHAFSRILVQDKAQPLRTGDASLVFEGRIFPAQNLKCDAEIFALKVSEGETERLKKFVRETRGDFVFVLMKPERLVVGRDVLGVKPLYYGENRVFAGLASERKALWKIGIRDVNSFPPGTVAEVSKHGFRFVGAKRIVASNPTQQTIEQASRRLENLLEKSVCERTAGLEEVAVAFSGGLDSSIIAFLASRAGAHVQLVHVSLENQSETEHAKNVADELKLPIHSGTYTEKDVLETLPNVLRLIEENDPVKTSVGIPFFWMAKTAAQLRQKVVLAGQGGDELFAGYRRYVDDYISKGPEKVQQTIFQDITEMHKNNLERDVKICNFHGIELRLPFATYEMAKFALSLPLELKLQPTQNTLRKLVLRQVGHNLGLPQSVIDRPKKAVQYTTGVNKVLESLARRNKQSLMEYLTRVYQTVLNKDDLA
ncbi:MAG TPA: asparagine synthetase B [Candidatus Eisenbacteria bacterium]|nr:asparagine synthetase B [Candidatus Eisenbacteria bacterium]